MYVDVKNWILLYLCLLGPISFPMGGLMDKPDLLVKCVRSYSCETA